jgi:protein SCO1/2
MPLSRARIALAAGAALLVGLAATYAFTRKDAAQAFAACGASQVMGGASAIGGPFTLTNQDGQVVTDKDVLTKPSLVYFGYTSCPDVCPADVGRNVNAVDILEEEYGQDVTPVFISVDPARDKPEVLKEWAGYMHPKLVGLTGTPDQIRKAALAYKVYYKVPDPIPGPDYEVDHTVQTYLMLPGVGFADFYGREATADDIAKRASCLIEAAAKLK